MPDIRPVSAIICTRNRSDLIGTAVSSVLANAYPSFDLLVVDQSTDGRTGEIVRGLAVDHRNLRYIHTDRPGLSRAYNFGIRETTGEILAFTDDDCVAPNDWIEAIVAAFDAESEAELMYGQVMLPAALSDQADHVPTLPIGEAYRLNRRRSSFQLYGMGANFAARRSLFERIGPFDEVLGGGGPLKSSQDYDLQYRAYVAGVTTAYRPEVKIDHYGLRAPEQWPATDRAYGTGDGAFYTKHARCGDLYALRLLLAQLVKVAVREALHEVGLRRRYSRSRYLRGYLSGIVGSFGFRVDRARRLYVMG
jgi:glycosyltransferase involved in cell wall biosynthesis